MARLPFYVATERPQPGQPVLARPQGNPLADVAQGIGQFAEKQRQLAEQREAIEVSKEVATLKGEWVKRFLDAQENAEDGAAGFTDNLLADYEKDVQARVGRFSERGQAYFTERAINFRSSLLQDATGFEARARGEKTARDVTETLNTHINAIRSNPNLYKGSLEEIEGLIRAAPLPPALRAKMTAEAKEQATSAAVLALSDRNPSAALAALRAGEYDDGLSPKAKSGLINAVEVDIRQRNAEARAAAAEARAAKAEQERAVERQRQIDAAKFEVAVREGKFDREDIEERWADGKGSMRPGEYVELVSLQARAAAERAKADAGVNKVRAALDSGVGLDYKNADDRKAVDQYFQQYFAPSLANEDAETQASAVVNYADKVGMVPESVQSAMRVNLRNGTPDQIVRASDFVARVQERNPQLLNDFSADEIAMGTMVTQQVRSGVEPDRAVLQAREAMAVPEAVKNERTIRFRADKMADKIPTLLKNEFANFFSRNPEVPDYATAEFRQSFENYYRTTGDAAVAEKAALADFKRVWGESEVNGRKQLMRYAPEKFYAVAGETDYIREQLLSEVRPLVYGDKVDSVVLVPDSKTAREASTGLPTYAVMQQDDQGRFIPVMREGVPQRFRPDPSKMADEYKARKLKEAEKLRDSTRRKNEPFRGFPSIQKEVDQMVPNADR